MVKLSDFLIEANQSSSEQNAERHSLRLEKTLKYLESKKKVLLITTSNRWEGHKDDVPKSTQLAQSIVEKLGTDKCTLIDASKLHICVCEGNVSSKTGNHCGTKDSLLKDKDKNPSGYHRCWASLNNKNDELWKITKELFESDVVLFFISIRWGQTNSIYQKLIERLCWIENRHTTLGESNIVKNIDAGIIAIGQNWNGNDVVQTQKQVLEFYGFKTPSELFWNWQFTDQTTDEKKSSYSKAIKIFDNTFLR